MRGADVRVVCCDGFFENCPIGGKPPQKEICHHCTNSAVNLFLKFNLPIIQLSSLLNQYDSVQCRKWVNNLIVDKIPTAVFEGFGIGKWIYAGICSYFRVGSPDLQDEEVERIYRSFLFNGALLVRAHRKLFTDFYPEHVICYSGVQAWYSIFLELTRHFNVPVLVHEKGMIDDSFGLFENGNPNISAGRIEAWKKWENIPLTTQECKKIAEHIKEREYARNIGRVVYYTLEPTKGDTRKILRIPPDAKIVAIFTNSEWELGMGNSYILRRFKHAIDGLRQIVESLASENVYLVFRLHPNMVGPNHTDICFVEDLFKFIREIPDNVRVVMPKERLRSYDIVWHADAIITSGSSMGLESNLRGVFANSNVDNVFSRLQKGIDKIETSTDYKRAVREAMIKTENFGIDALKAAYRGFYFYNFRLSYKFKSFGIRNFFQPDIRIKQQSQLEEGNDPTLDHICNHILFNKPLYLQPDEKDLLRSEKEETAFLERELEKIYSKRSQIRKQSFNNSNYTEPLVSIARIRLHSISEKDDPNTYLYNTIEKSRHKNIEKMRNIAFPYSMDISFFLKELNTGANVAKGNYIYFGVDNTQINESFISTAVDFLEEPENESCDGIVSGAWICDKMGNLVEGSSDIFTERSDINDYITAIGILPLLKNPAQMLALFLWRKEAFISLVRDLEEHVPENLALTIFEKTLSKKPSMNLQKTLVPAVIVHITPKPEELISEGLSCLHKGKLKETIRFLDYAKDLGATDQNLNYYRSAAMAGLGKHWEARLIAEAHIKENPADDKTRNLIIEIIKRIDGKDIQYKDIESTAENVDGALVQGQEQFLFEKVKSLPDYATILEIGAAYGRSTTAMAYACHGTSKRVFSIDKFKHIYDANGNDIYNIEGGIVKYELDFFDLWYRNIRRFGLEKYVTPLVGYSHEILSQWGDKPKLDFVFIDGSYHYSDVLKDFELVYPLLKNWGWIAFHDIDWQGPGTVWKENAIHLLSSHEYCANLGCGQKVNEKQEPSTIHYISPSLQVDIKTMVKQALRELNSGNNETSLQIFQQIMINQPELSGVCYGEAVALARMGKIDEASVKLKQLLRIQPFNTKAYLLLEELNTLRACLKIIYK